MVGGEHSAGTRELYLKTVLNWENRDAGTHTETWDGRDSSGNIINLSEAIMIIEGEPISDYAPGTMEHEGETPEEVIHGHMWGHAHGKHAEFAEELPELTVTSINDNDVLSDIVTIKSEVSKSRRGYGDDVGYGVRYYLDEELIQEEFYNGKSDGNFSYDFDTTAFEDGEYTLYIGMCDHNQHVTSRGIKIKIDNSF